MNKKTMFLLLGAIVLGLFTGLAFATRNQRGRITGNYPPPGGETIVAEQQASYVQVTQKELIEKAGLIFAGRVATISPTRWNQDDGSKWDGGLTLHYVEIDVYHNIAGDVRQGQRISLTILGVSPLEGHADYNFRVGDSGIYFAKSTDLAWRDGSRTMNMLIGVPESSYLLADKDGVFSGQLFGQSMSLDEVARLVAQQRAPTNQP